MADIVQRMFNTTYGDGLHKLDDGKAITLSTDPPRAQYVVPLIKWVAVVDAEPELTGGAKGTIIVRELGYAYDGAAGGPATYRWAASARITAVPGFGHSVDEFKSDVADDSVNPDENTKGYLLFLRPSGLPLLFPLGGGGESQLADFRIQSIEDEWLTTVPVVQGEVDPDAPAPEVVIVWRTRGARNPRGGSSEGDIDYTWDGVNNRTAIRASDGEMEHQVLTPAYSVGQEITAKTRITGTPDDVVWVEENERGRAWAQLPQVEDELEP